MIPDPVRRISSSLQIIVDLDAAEEEINYRFHLARLINKHSKLFLEGHISGSEFLDLAETTGINIDLYSEEVEENLEEIGFLR